MRLLKKIKNYLKLTNEEAVKNECLEDQWQVSIFDYDFIKFKKTKRLKKLIKLINKQIKKGF